MTWSHLPALMLDQREPVSLVDDRLLRRFSVSYAEELQPFDSAGAG